jgi:hypothetical protein
VFSTERVPDETTGAGIVNKKLGALAIGLVVSAQLPAQGWIEYSDRAQFFSINFPGEPEISEIDYPSEFGAVYPARLYTVRQGPSAYSVTVVDFTEAKVPHQEPDDKTDDTSPRSLWIYDQLSSIAQAARGFRQRGGEVTLDAWHNIDRVSGHMLQISNDDGTRTFAGIYLHSNRLYILEATVPASAPPPGLFQASLSFLDEEGRAIRYELDPDGTRNRIR